ncbi:cell wall hydrolase [Sphingobium boeckii]|uniref:Spore germination cell wall hydrolase CwlJ-like protein n=1 Tax=Sphingobium boeckii TaxID=1082345 RepID=A0A7W9AJK6_9SPHN|nr:spore germination cell wall hydrolase CwlJ-like protein [Sphingobium boeckii]
MANTPSFWMRNPSFWLILLSVILCAGTLAWGFIPPTAAPVYTLPVELVIPTDAKRIALEAGPETFTFQQVAPEKAVELNAAVPLVTGPNPPAKPFKFDLAATTAIGRLTAIDCLTAAIYYEAASETETGQRAVAQVVLNRVRHPSYPNSVCGVVFQGAERSTGCQFTFTCDGALARPPVPALWLRARRFAEQALSGFVERNVGLSTHYHTNWVVPYWSGNLAKTALVGTHIFYRWQGGAGTPRAFTNHYAGEGPPPTKFALLQGFLMSQDGSALPVDPLVAETPALAEVPKAPETPPSPLPTTRKVAADAAKPTLAADENRGQLVRDQAQ